MDCTKLIFAGMVCNLILILFLIIFSGHTATGISMVGIDQEGNVCGFVYSIFICLFNLI